MIVRRFWQRALALTKPGAACIKLFVEGFELYMKSMVQEAKDRETKRVRPVDDYLQLRRETFGAQATISLLGFGLEIPEEVLSHPVMQSMLLAAMDLLCITNVSNQSYESNHGLGITAFTGYAFLSNRASAWNCVPQYRFFHHPRARIECACGYAVAREFWKRQSQSILGRDREIAVLGAGD
jgi:hypothetical protein